jgi:protein-disulfide isomerase
MLSRLSFVKVVLVSTLLSLTSSLGLAQTTPEQELTIPLPSKEDILVIKKDDIAIGSDKAPVSIIKYSSLSCTHCASFYNNVYDELKKKYIDTGDVRFVFRDFPLNLQALHATMMVRCAPKDKTEKFISALFSTQNNWATKKNYLEILSNIAKLGGMSGKDFDACIANKELENTLTIERFQAAKALEIRATPTFFINGAPYAGKHDLTSLSAVIDPLLGKTVNTSEKQEKSTTSSSPAQEDSKE